VLVSELEQLVTSICTQSHNLQNVATVSTAEGLSAVCDLVSAFANQPQGGTIVFGVDDEGAVCGVQGGTLDLQQDVYELCSQMEPPVEPLFTAARVAGASVVCAQIPAVEPAQRPCYHAGTGVERGAFVRKGGATRLLTAREVYAMRADANLLRVDQRPAEGLDADALDPAATGAYLAALREGRPSVADLSDDALLQLAGIVRDGVPTLAGVELFGRLPQAAFPQLRVVVTAVDAQGAETITQVDGTIPQMVERTVELVCAAAAPDGRSVPAAAVRAAVVNALEHRDYSDYAASTPVQVRVSGEGVEVVSPGGLFGATCLAHLADGRRDVRNPTIVRALVVLGLTADNQTGVAAMNRAAVEASIVRPAFAADLLSFTATLGTAAGRSRRAETNDDTARLLEFCVEPRNRAQIAELFGLSSIAYVTKHYITPAIESGLLSMSLPDKPRSKKQLYQTIL
jgi:ATP-dependent DNA helicase RecG